MKKFATGLLILGATLVTGCVSQNDGPAADTDAPATTSESIVSSLSINEVNPLTGCGPRDVASAREWLRKSGMQIGLDADGLARGELSFNTDVASSTNNYIQLPLQRRYEEGQDPSGDPYLEPWVPVPADYTSVEYWDKRSGRVDTSAEVAKITDDLAAWADNLLSVMSIDDPRWLEEGRYVNSVDELEHRYESYRHGLTALAEQKKVISYAPSHTIISPRDQAGDQPSSHEDLLYLTFEETEKDRFGNTLATSNVESSTNFRIIAAEPPGSSDPTQFLAGGRLDFSSNDSDTRNLDLRFAFGEGLGGGFLDKRRFTFGASIQFEPFPTLDPLDGLSAEAIMPGNEDLTREVYRYYFDQNDIMIGGRASGWIKVGLNLRCQIEISLNSYPIDANFDSHTTILVSERVLNIGQASQILFTVDSEAGQVTLTTGDGAREALVTEVFDLPDGFRWGFDTTAIICKETGSCDPNPDQMENFLSITSEDFHGQTISPKGLRGSIDWVYLANGVLSPQDAFSHLIALDLKESVRGNFDGESTFIVSPDGHVANLALGNDKYEIFLDTDPTQRMMLAVQEAILEFGDNFDVIAFVPRDAMSELAMGSSVGRNYPVRKTPGTYNLDFVYPVPYAWGNPEKLRSVLIGQSPGFMTTSTFLHEMAHTWANDVVFPTGTAQYLVDGHFGISSANGYLGGFDPSTLRSEGSNLYSAAAFSSYAGLPEFYADIELYLMGLLPANNVDDLTIFVNTSEVEDRGNRTFFKAEGSEIITVSEIERLAGKRTLESDTEFEILYVVVSGQALGDAELKAYDSQAELAAQNFKNATRGLATLSLKSVGP